MNLSISHTPETIRWEWTISGSVTQAMEIETGRLEKAAGGVTIELLKLIGDLAEQVSYAAHGINR